MLGTLFEPSAKQQSVSKLFRNNPEIIQKLFDLKAAMGLGRCSLAEGFQGCCSMLLDALLPDC